ncbi:MAG: nucleotidyltransferase domain-containing protein [Candidatus Omnitrophica bacterium]|nr:nucleotidyltransferase domain-containing protein [Candidatus Omnitrophota bacterium]
MENINLPKESKAALDDFIRRLKSAYGEGLVSVILYGSAASGEFIKKHSDINLLVVLADAGLPNLKKSSRIVIKHKFRMFKTIFLTEDYIKNSLDVFPVEFLDMKETHIVLDGKDVLEGLEIDFKNLRFQCEQELKAKLLSIRNIYLNTKDNRELKNILLKSFTSITHIMRNLLRLKGKTPPYLKEDVLTAISREFNLNVSNFSRILEVKQKNIKLPIMEIESLLFAFVKDIESIVGIIDKL